MSRSRHEMVHRVFTEAAGLPLDERAAFLDAHCGGDVDLRGEIEAMLAADARTGGTFDGIVGAGGGAEFLAGALGERLERVVTDAGRLAPAEREAFLDEACGDDPAFRREVERLLAPDADTAAEMATAAAGRAGGGRRDRPGMPSVERIGRYDVRRVIGQGGMGTVYEAEQDSPRRRVALKVINPGVVSPELLRRFEFEAEILGRLQHPGIAQIFEAGTFDQGAGAQPFFAMELVEGEPLLRYAQLNDLGNRARLALLAQVCDAVEHAHQRGVIHRDLKPGNILVDGAGQSKVLDFGVARATDADIQTATLRTDVGQLIGTIPYMSPEQASGDPNALDTRSDVYALGVVAYQLLTNRLPYDVGRKMIHEAVRVIQEEDPAPLSTIDRVFRGDVEIIVGKTLAKEKDRRYQSAGDLATDIRRYLSHEPIDARPPSASYQIGKFARRNKTLVTGVVAVFAVMVAGLIGISLALARAVRAEGIARENEQLALTEAKKSEQIAGFTTGMLGGIDPDIAGDMDKRLMRMILDDASRRVETELAGQPEVEAEIRDTIGLAYLAIAEYPPAASHLGSALETRRELLGNEHADTLRSVGNLASLLRARGQLAEADPLHEEALAGQRRLLGDEHRDTLAARAGRGHLLLSQGNMEEAEREFREVLEIRRRVLDADDPETLRVMSSLGTVLRIRGQLDDAERVLREALDGYRRVLGDRHPQTLTVASILGGVQTDRGDVADAEPLLREAVEGQRLVLGPDHPNTLSSLNNLGAVLLTLGKFEESESLYREALDGVRRVLGDDHPETLVTLNNLGHLLRDRGQLDESERLLRDAADGSRRILGMDHRETLMAMVNLAGVLSMRMRLDEAASVLREALEPCRRVLGNEHPVTLLALSTLGDVLRSQGQLDEAEALLREVLDARRGLHGDDHPETHASINNLATLHQSRGNLEEAEALFRESYEGKRRLLGDEHPVTLLAVNNLGLVIKRAGRLDEAEPLYRRALRGYRGTLGDEHPNTLIAINNLGSLLESQGKLEEAETLYREALDGRRVSLGIEHPYTLSSITKLVGLLWAAGRYDEAMPLIGEALDSRRQAQPVDETALASVLAWIGSLEIDRGNHVEAERLLRECLEIRERLLDPDHWLLFNTRSLLGETLTGQGRYAEAEPILIDASVGLDDAEGTPEDRQRDAWQRVVDLYEAWGRTNEAEAWRRDG